MNPLARPLVFGDLEQIAALRRLPREGALSAFTFAYSLRRDGTVRVVGTDADRARDVARSELDDDAELDDDDPEMAPATEDDKDGDVTVDES